MLVFRCAPVVGFEYVLVEAVLEGQQADVGNFYCQSLLLHFLATVAVNSTDGVVVETILLYNVGVAYILDECIVYFNIVAVKVEALELVLCRGFGAHAVGAHKYVVDEQHEGLERYAVDGDVFGLRGDVVLKERPFGRNFDILAGIDVGEVGGLLAGSRITYSEAFQAIGIGVALGTETNLEVLLKV